jgi:hypothetical protein
MGFFHQYLPLSMLLEKGRLICFTIVFMYALNTKSWSLCFLHFILSILSWRFHCSIFAGWNLGHCKRQFHRCQRLWRCLLSFLLLTFGWPAARGPRCEILWNQVCFLFFLKMIQSLIQLISILSFISCPGNPSQQPSNMAG